MQLLTSVAVTGITGVQRGHGVVLLARSIVGWKPNVSGTHHFHSRRGCHGPTCTRKVVASYFGAPTATTDSPQARCSCRQTAVRPSFLDGLLLSATTRSILLLKFFKLLLCSYFDGAKFLCSLALLRTPRFVRIPTHLSSGNVIIGSATR
jgi:hypothetical protein